jgi:hypothetical protein
VVECEPHLTAFPGTQGAKDRAERLFHRLPCEYVDIVSALDLLDEVVFTLSVTNVFPVEMG